MRVRITFRIQVTPALNDAANPSGSSCPTGRRKSISASDPVSSRRPSSFFLRFVVLLPFPR